MSLEIIAKQLLTGATEPTEELLIDVLTDTTDQYYNDGESYLTDAEYDALEQMLVVINPKNEFLAAVGSDVRGGKIKLPIPMGSLDQAYEGEVEKWVRSNGWLNETFVLSDKQDGVSVLLVYGPELKVAYSRGNGTMGADITRHIKRISSVPKTMLQPCTIRAEVIMPIAAFKELMQEEAAAGRRVYKNPRNYVSGRLNASESTDTFYNNVKVIATSVESPALSKIEQFEWTDGRKFDTTYSVVYRGIDITDEMLTKYLNGRRAISKTEIDGIVIDLNKSSIRTSLSRKSSSLNPMYARKYKIGDASNVAVTEVVKVHWEPSKTGYLKPRVQVKPVELAGVTIQYATGFNARFIRDSGIGPGAMIQITRSGDVIPFIQKVITPTAPQLPTVEEFGEMFWNETDVDLVLENPDDNDAVQLNKLFETFRALEVPALREGSVTALYEAGHKTAADIIKLPESTFVSVIGESNGKKIFQGLKQKLNPIPLGILAGASQMFGRGIGRRKMTKLIEGLGGSLDSIRSNKLIPYSSGQIAKITAVEGFEETTAKKIILNLHAFDEFLEEIEGYYTLAQPKEKVMGGSLDNVVVVFTGVRDKALEAVIESKGGTIGSSVGPKTTHLVAKDPNATSGKLKKATDLGIKPISLEEAQTLWI